MGLFADLAQMAGKGAVLFSVGNAGGEQITLTVQPVGAAMATAFQITAMPEQLDKWLASGELIAAMSQYRQQQASLAEVLEATKAVIDEAAKDAARAATKGAATRAPQVVGTTVGEADNEFEDEANDDEVTVNAKAAPAPQAAKPAVAQPVKSIFG